MPRSYADFGIGVRSHDYSYESFVGPEGVTLEADSFSRTDFARELIMPRTSPEPARAAT